MTRADIQIICVIAIPVIGMAMAWGHTSNRVANLEQSQSKYINVNQIDVIKMEIEYIKEKQEDNKTLLLEILDKITR